MLVDHVLVHQIAGHLDGGARRALARARLQEVELALLHGELDVLHVLVVALETPGDLENLVVDRRHALVQGLDRQRRADAGHDVLALRVGQELGIEPRLARPGVTREPDAGAGGFAEVAEDHGHHGDRGAPLLRDVVDAPILGGLLREPGIEHGVDGQPKLLLHVLRERAARPLADDALEDIGQLSELGGRHLGVALDAETRLRRVELGVEDFAPHAQDDVAEHHDEAPVAVPREALVTRARRQSLDGRVVQAEIEDRLHHPGHRYAGARADRHEEGPFGVAESGVRGGLDPLEVFEGLLPQLLGPLVPGSVVVSPSLRRHGESWRHGNAEVGHFRQFAAFATEQVPHDRGAFGTAPTEEVDVFRHRRGSPSPMTKKVL